MIKLSRKHKKMKRELFIVLVALLSLQARAYELSSDADTSDKKTHMVEMRQSAAVSLPFAEKWDVMLSEEIREVLYDSNQSPTAYFSKSYTSAALGWKFFSYTDTYNNYKYGLKLQAGYTLRYLHQKLYSSGVKQGPEEFLRHRPYAVLSGSANFGLVKLTLRERFLADCRADSVNVLEKPKCNMELRHRLTADFNLPGKTYKPFTYIEFANTLNQPSCYNASGVQLYGGQYLCAVRAKVGLRWNIDKKNQLTFAYSFHFSQQREVNITRKSQEINRLYMDQTYKHVVTVSYEFNNK